jgi:hypothetical protein
MKLTDRERKLLILAFDPAATAGETVAALRVVFRDWIRKYSDGYALVKDLESVEKTVSHDRGGRYGEVVLGFGKYRGQALKDVPESYLLWVLDNFEGLWPQTRRAIERYLEGSE